MDEPKKIVEKKEFIDMFDQSFLPYVEKFCKRVMKIRENDEIKYFVLSLQLSVTPEDFPLSFEKIEQINMSISPVTQEELDLVDVVRESLAKKNNENAEINS